MTTTSSDIRSILDSIRRIVQALRVSSRAAEKDVGLSGAQLFVLQQLGDGRRLSVNELAERSFTHQSSVSEVVQRLVEKGFVERKQSETDGRRAAVSLTASGQTRLKKLRASRGPDPFQHRLIQTLEQMSAKQRAQLSSLLLQVVQNSGLGGETPELFFEGDLSRSGLHLAVVMDKDMSLPKQAKRTAKKPRPKKEKEAVRS